TLLTLGFVMGQQRYSGSVVACRLQDAPFVDERNRYLRHCAAHGARPSGLKVKRYELRWIARRLGPDAHFGVGMTELMQIAPCFCTGTTSTVMSPGCATSVASRQRRWSNGAGQPRDSCCGALEQAASSGI